MVSGVCFATWLCEWDLKVRFGFANRLCAVSLRIGRASRIRELIRIFVMRIGLAMPICGVGLRIGFTNEFTKWIFALALRVGREGGDLGRFCECLWAGLPGLEF